MENNYTWVGVLEVKSKAPLTLTLLGKVVPSFFAGTPVETWTKRPPANKNTRRKVEPTAKTVAAVTVCNALEESTKLYKHAEALLASKANDCALALGPEAALAPAPAFAPEQQS